jgi:hypothetical protein
MGRQDHHATLIGNVGYDSCSIPAMKLAGWVLVLAFAVGCKAKEKAAPPPPTPAPVPTAASGAKPATPEQQATAAYEAKDFKRCAELFLAIGTADALYNAACCQALAGDRDPAFATLDKVFAGGFRDVTHLKEDTDLTSLHDDPRWAKAISATEANIAKFEATLKEPALRREILAMRDEDQAARKEVIAKEKDADALTKLEAIDKKTTTRMKELVAKHGWPGNSLVGQDAAKAAWLLVQHADKDVAFQKQCLELLEKAVKAGEASAIDHAYLYDRVAVAEQRPQRYGTQFRDQKPQPIEDEEHVDERRTALGLGTMASYAKDMERMYGKKFSPTTK